MAELKERLLTVLPVFILLCVATVLIWSLFTSASTITETNSEDNNQTTEIEWYPWKLTPDGSQQEIPMVEWTSHEKFKKLCELYWLDASLIWELENKYNLREGILLAILIAETSWGNNWNYVDEWCYNLGNVGNTDSWQRVCFEWKEVSIEQVAITLNNRMLGKTITLWCLSNAGSCQWRDDWGYRYATSNGNRERNVKAVMNMIYADSLWEEVDPARFVVKRVSFQ
jgi:hypothetical protein